MRVKIQWVNCNVLGLLGHILNKRAGGVMVSIVAFQAVGPGSISGQRIDLFLFYVKDPM